MVCCCKRRPKTKVISPPASVDPHLAGAHADLESAHSDSRYSSSERNSRYRAIKAVQPGGIGAGQLCVDNLCSVYEKYHLEKVMLGEGAYGTVRKARRKGMPKSAPRAVKMVSVADVANNERFEQEIAIMRVMDHPNICKLYETFQDERYIYLVMEVLEGGELFDRIVEAGQLNELQAAICMRQILRAIAYLHKMHICHRDLKCENFLLETKDPIETNQLKVIDFGLACPFKPGQKLQTKAGSAYYAAPEIQNGKYDETSDLWSLGVIMYVLLCGYPPFYGGDDRQVLAKVKKGKFEFKDDDWKNVSKGAKELIRLMLIMDPQDRYTAQQALFHPWVQETAPEARNVQVEQNLVGNLRSFQAMNKFKKAALHIIARKLDEDAIGQLREVFTSMDQDGDGLLTADELQAGLLRAAVQDVPHDLQQLLEGIDTDGSGMIDYTEFIAAALEKKHYTQEATLWEAFNVFDNDADGLISLGELRTILGDDNLLETASSKATEALIRELGSACADGDAAVSFEDFKVMMRSTPAVQPGGTPSCPKATGELGAEFSGEAPGSPAGGKAVMPQPIDSTSTTASSREAPGVTTAAVSLPDVVIDMSCA